MSDHELAFKLQQDFDREASWSFSTDPNFTICLSDSDDDVDSGASNGTIPVTNRPQHTNPFTSPNKAQNTGVPTSLVDPEWDIIDPNPDIHSLFIQFNSILFGGKLLSVELKWSYRMTLCAGVCSYSGKRSGYCSIRLSQPLLKFRPRKDVVETLLHEMIHALLFVTDNNKDHDGHGPEFHNHMNRINKETGTKISVYHNFKDEVDMYRQHIWRCNGPCQKWKPYFGIVKRAMNRVPSVRDPWFGNHQNTCGGAFIKIKQPEGYGEKKKSNRTTSEGGTKQKSKSAAVKRPGPDLTNVKTEKNKKIDKQKDEESTSDDTTTTTTTTDIRTFIPFSGRGHFLMNTGTSHEKSSVIPNTGKLSVKTITPSSTQHTLHKPTGPSHSNKTLPSTPVASMNIRDYFKQGSTTTVPPPPSTASLPTTVMYQCPACSKDVQSSLINQHLDSCLSLKENC